MENSILVVTNNHRVVIDKYMGTNFKSQYMEEEPINNVKNWVKNQTTRVHFSMDLSIN